MRPSEPAGKPKEPFVHPSLIARAKAAIPGRDNFILVHA